MFKNYALSLVLTFSFTFFAFSQTICDTNNGMAGIFPCNDYDLMSIIPNNILGDTSDTNYNPEGSDIWGWTDSTTGKEYAIMGLTNSTAFVDITDPINPIFLGRINSAAGRNFWRDVKVYNNHAFIVADQVGVHGMQIFDLTILRNGPEADKTYDGAQVLKFTGNGGTGDISIRSCHNIVINESEGIAYLVGCSSANGGGPIFVDISDPTNPNVLGDYTTGGYSHDAQVVTYTGPDTDYYDPANGIIGKQIYIGSNGNTDRVVILDVTDKTNVIPINSFTYTQTRYAHQGWFTDDQKYFIMGDEVDEQSIGFNTKTIIFDFSDLDAAFDSTPSLTRFYFGPERAIDHNGYVKGNLFFLANYRAGIRVIDITDIDTVNPMTEIGYFDTYPASNSASFNGAWSVYPYFPSGNIIISDIERGLIVVRKSNTLSTPSFETETEISLSPNPAKDFTIIKSNNKTPIKNVIIYNLLGQEIKSYDNIDSIDFKINTSQLGKGLYIVKINNISKKLIIK